MLPTLMVIGGLIWFAVLLYYVTSRGFTVLLIWLFIAPLALYVWTNAGSNFSERRTVDEEEPVVQTKSKQVVKRHYLDALEGNKDNAVRVREFLEPHRLLSGMFLIGLLLDVFGRRQRLGRLDRTEICMVLFSVILLSSVLLKAELLRFALRLATDAFLVSLFAYFIMRRFVTTEERFEKVVRVLGYVGVYLIVIALIERMLQPSLLYRVEGPFSHRDRLYVVMIVVFFVVLAEHLRSTTFTSRKPSLPGAARWFVVCLAPLVVFLTLTRGNWLGFAFAMWVCLAFAFRLINFPRKLATLSLLLLLVPIMSVGWQALLSPEIVEDRISQPRNVYARLATWQTTLEVFTENPILGIGLNNSRAFLELRAANFEGVKNLRSVHNSFLAMLTELGIVGFLAYLGIFACMMQTGFSLYRDGSNLRDRWRGVAVICIIVAYLVPAFFSGLFYIPTVSHTYVFAYIGAIAGFYGQRRQIGKAQLAQRAVEGQRQIAVLSASRRKVRWV